MRFQRHLSSLLCVVILVSIIGCQPALKPFPTNTPTALATSQPTETPTETAIPSTATPSPTATSEPFCGNAASPQTTAPFTNTSKEFAKFEPPDNQVYFGFAYETQVGAYWGDSRPFMERICDSVEFELSGKTPSLMWVGSQWGSSFSNVLGEARRISSAMGPSVTFNVDWHVNFVYTPKDIAAGKSDGYIKQYARDVKNYGKPLFIQPLCGEFNGNWDTSCSPKVNPDLTSDDFVNAWQRVVDIFRQEGVTNVAWVWAPAVPLPPASGDWGWDPSWWAYYPGDSYVDWIGAHQDGWGEPNWIYPLNQFGIDHHKPLMVIFAIRHQLSGRSRAQWINWLAGMFDYFKSHPQIKAIIYTNINWHVGTPDRKDRVFLYDGKVSYVPNANDADRRLIAGGEDIRKLFSDQIADPRYISILVGEP